MKRRSASIFWTMMLGIPLSAAAWTVSVGTWVCNPDAGVAVPVDIDDAAGLAHVAVRVNYDPQVLVCLGIERGGLEDAFDGDFLFADDEAGSLRFARFRASDGVAGAGGGTLARLRFAVRPGTARQYSDLAVADVGVGDDTGVRDLTVGAEVVPEGGMVRIFSENGAVARLEGAQTVVAGTRLASLSLAEGDAIQAGVGAGVVVSGETRGAAGGIPVVAPDGGWTGGTYVLLKTATKGLRFVSAENGGGALDVRETEEDGMSVYTLAIADGGPDVVAEDGELGEKATAYVKQLFAGETEVEQITVKGGERNVLLARVLGIRPAEVRAGTTLEATFSEPTLEIVDYNLETGVVKVRVTPGTGNTIETALVKGVVRLLGGATPGAFQEIAQSEFSVSPELYLNEDSKGEFEVGFALDFGVTSFLRVAVEVEE